LPPLPPKGLLRGPNPPCRPPPGRADPPHRVPAHRIPTNTTR
jgi:hypothetical protein